LLHGVGLEYVITLAVVAEAYELWNSVIFFIPVVSHLSPLSPYVYFHQVYKIFVVPFLEPLVSNPLTLIFCPYPIRVVFPRSNSNSHKGRSTWQPVRTGWDLISHAIDFVQFLLFVHCPCQILEPYFPPLRYLPSPYFHCSGTNNNRFLFPTPSLGCH